MRAGPLIPLRRIDRRRAADSDTKPGSMRGPARIVFPTAVLSDHRHQLTAPNQETSLLVDGLDMVRNGRHPNRIVTFRASVVVKDLAPDASRARIVRPRPDVTGGVKDRDLIDEAPLAAVDINHAGFDHT